MLPAENQEGPLIVIRLSVTLLSLGTKKFGLRLPFVESPMGSLGESTIDKRYRSRLLPAATAGGLNQKAATFASSTMPGFPHDRRVRGQPAAEAPEYGKVEILHARCGGPYATGCPGAEIFGPGQVSRCHEPKSLLEPVNVLQKPFGSVGGIRFVVESPPPSVGMTPVGTAHAQYILTVTSVAGSGPRLRTRT